MNKQKPLTDDDVMCQGYYVCEEEPRTFWKTALKHILQVKAHLTVGTTIPPFNCEVIQMIESIWY